MTLRRLLSCCAAALILLVFDPAKAANQMAGHPSPYLALHAADPVNWHTWDEQVFAAARGNNRLVYVSIGYFSCHWCHVMQRESYRDQGVAEVLNAGFIPVKVDRELDPDLDRRLLAFVEKVGGSAGWPLNVFLTPDGYPLTGFTYLSRDSFVDVLLKLDVEWRRDHSRLAAAAKEFFDTEMRNLANQAYDAPKIPPQELRDAFLSQVMLAADELEGGFGNTSKFPSVPQLEVLLELIRYDANLDPDVARFVRLTLDSMASRHLADHVGDGFFRYTTDPDWQTPHFEKMLYDNAQLASLYLAAHRLWPGANYADIALRTLDFVEISLKHPAGGYLSSLSAVDDANREGGAYFWTREQLGDYLDDRELAYLDELWDLPSQQREFLPGPLLGTHAAGDPETNRRIREKLRLRKSRVMPADGKRLASWNAMMLRALTEAANQDSSYRVRAEAQYRAMTAIFFRDDGSLIRLAGNDEVAEAVFEDYAEVAHAFSNYGKAFDHAEATTTAVGLAERAHRRFLIEGRWRQKTATLIPLEQGHWVIPDQVFDSPMSRWLEVVFDAPVVDPAVRASARAMLGRATREMLDAPYFYGSFILLRVRHSG